MTCTAATYVMEGVKTSTPTANAARGAGEDAILITRLGFLSGSGGRGFLRVSRRLTPRARTPSPRRRPYRAWCSLGWLRPPARSTRNRATAITTVISAAPDRKNSAARRGLADPRKTATRTSAVGEIAPSRAYPAACASMVPAAHALGRLAIAAPIPRSVISRARPPAGRPPPSQATRSPSGLCPGEHHPSAPAERPRHPLRVIGLRPSAGTHVGKDAQGAEEGQDEKQPEISERDRDRAPHAVDDRGGHDDRRSLHHRPVRRDHWRDRGVRRDPALSAGVGDDSCRDDPAPAGPGQGGGRRHGDRLAAAQRRARAGRARPSLTQRLASRGPSAGVAAVAVPGSGQDVGAIHRLAM